MEMTLHSNEPAMWGNGVSHRVYYNTYFCASVKRTKTDLMCIQKVQIGII